MLAGYITADGILDLYYGKLIWVYREGFFYKLPFILVTLNFIYLAITGFISCFSFFTLEDPHQHHFSKHCSILCIVGLYNVLL